MFKFTLQNTDWFARSAEIETSHGTIETPIFMPVGTKASVTGISKEDLDTMWAQIILNNTYHLYLRPGDEVVKHFGWAHNFQNYHQPILTDSWGFQVFSLGDLKRPVFNETGLNKAAESLVKITEDGVHFRSYIKGINSSIGLQVMDTWDNVLKRRYGRLILETKLKC
jgi:queuine tRNA-ribosyltransferase